MKKPRRVRKGRDPGSSSTRKSEIVTFEFPDWAPLPVCKLAARMYVTGWNGADPELLLILNRLTSDARMENVWTELRKRRRQKYVKTNNFMHPATAPGLQTSWTPGARSLRERAKEMRRSRRQVEAKRLDIYAAVSEITIPQEILPELGPQPVPTQDFALAWFFDQVVKLARHPPKPITLSDVLRLRKPYVAMASRLRADAAKQKGYSEPLMAAADAYEGLADEVAPSPTSPLVVRRKPRGDEELKGFSIAVIEVTKGIFGQRLLRTVATLANVVFDRTDMTDSKLRKMLTLPPVSRPSKGSQGADS
jgi:hypothetical protein